MRSLPLFLLALGSCAASPPADALLLASEASQLARHPGVEAGFADWLSGTTFPVQQARLVAVPAPSLAARGPTIGLRLRAEIEDLGEGRRSSLLWELEWRDGAWQPTTDAPRRVEDYWAPYMTPDGRRTIQVAVHLDPGVPEAAGVELARGLLNGWLIGRQRWADGPPVWLRVTVRERDDGEEQDAVGDTDGPVVLRVSAGWGGFGTGFECFRGVDGRWIVLSDGNWII